MVEAGSSLLVGNLEDILVVEGSIPVAAAVSHMPAVDIRLVQVVVMRLDKIPVAPAKADAVSWPHTGLTLNCHALVVVAACSLSYAAEIVAFAQVVRMHSHYSNGLAPATDIVGTLPSDIDAAALDMSPVVVGIDPATVDMAPAGILQVANIVLEEGEGTGEGTHPVDVAIVVLVVAHCLGAAEMGFEVVPCCCSTEVSPAVCNQPAVPEKWSLDTGLVLVLGLDPLTHQIHDLRGHSKVHCH